MEKEEEFYDFDDDEWIVEDEDDDRSPVEEVALTVSTFDDPSMKTHTMRMWVIGGIVCALLSFVNQYFWFRAASIVINPISAVILSLYIGRAWARMFPQEGPFTVKEHVLISIFANCGSAFGNGNAYAIDIITIQRQFFNEKVSFFSALLLITTTQVLGFGWAGLLRRYLVEPAHMWWPTNLVNVSLYRTLHETDKPPKGLLTRVHFFFIIASMSFCWYTVPDYLIPITATMSWVCWVFPRSITAQQIGSGQYGMGIGAFSLDWATTSAFLGSPLASPWFAILNVGVGFVIMTYIVMPLIYWNNLFGARRFPFLSSRLFTWQGAIYPVMNIISSDGSLNIKQFDLVGRPYLSAYFAMGYGIGFAALTATLVHVALWYGNEIIQRSRAAAQENRPDIHTRIMRQNYSQVPDHWFIIILILNLGASVATLTAFPAFQLPWYGLLLAAIISFFFTLPVGIIAATTNQIPALNVLAEMLWGYLQPGHPIGNACFKTYGYISMTQAISFLQDFKLGCYMKIPPRTLFLVQVVGTTFAGLVNLGTAFWLYSTIENGNICRTDSLPENSQWTCPSANVFYTASVIWGLVGPSRMFGPTSYYKFLNWFFVGGAFLPVPFWGLYKLMPSQKWLSRVNIPVMLTGVGLIPPAAPINFASWLIMGFICNFLVFKFNKKWWMRYNYILSAGLDTGVMFMSVMVFLGSQLNPPNGSYLDKWWGAGNSVIDNCPLALCATDATSSSAFQWCPDRLAMGAATS